MSDNEAEVDVSFLPSPGQGGTGKRAVYEPDSAQRCKQVVCSRTWAIVIAAVFSAIIIAIAIIAAFARPGMTVCKETATQAPEPQTSTPPDPDAERFPWKEIRLPDSVIPINYDIFMHPNLTTFNFKGNVSIELKVVKPTDFIVLHSKNMNISTFDMFLDLSKSTKRVGITQTLVHRRQEQIYIAFDRELQTNKRYILKMSFHAILNDLMAGFYKSSYTTTTGEKRYLAVTQFEATDARAAFPCFDEPAMKATFALTMIHEPHHISLFNMPLVDTQDYHSGLQIDKFETSVKMSTYLVAFIVCDFESIHNVTSRGTKISVYAPKEQLSQAEFALDAAVVITEYYEHFFGSPFPLPKQDLVAIPDFSAGAMENWGLITYRMTELLYDPQISTGADKQRVAVVVAHELAHQWFGNLVTMQWWNDLWLNEGFASFVEYIGADRVNPEWDMMDQFVGDAVVAALYEDSLSNSHPISIPVKDPAEINEIFDAISYSKGASIIRMLEGFIGRENLQTGLMDYLHKYKYSNAQTDDLWQCLSDASKMDVKSVMDTWTLQQGYPVVMVSIRDGSVFAQQTQFNLNPHGMQVEVPSPFQYVWKIPINFVTNERPHEASELVWMEDLSTSFKISPDIKWIKVNVNFTGYYRVHYNENIWLALTQQLQENHQIFSTADRAELIDDVFALSRAQVKFESGALMSATIALDLVRYLHQELEYVPWSVALSNIGDVASLLQGTAMDEPFKEYTKSLVSKVLETLGWDHLDLYPRRELRTMLLKSAVNINYKPAVEKCKQIFQDWMLRNISVKPEYKLAVYATGIQYGGEEEWQFMWNQYTQTIVPSEKKHMLSSLAKTTDANRMQRYLQMSLEEDKIRKQDTVRVLARISQTSAGRTLAWSFIKRNWAEFNRRYGGGSFEMSGLVTSVTALFTTQHDYTDVQTFFTNNPVPNAKRAISQSLERIQMNIDWLNRNKKSVSEWLEKFSHETSGNIDASKQTNS